MSNSASSIDSIPDDGDNENQEEDVAEVYHQNNEEKIPYKIKWKIAKFDFISKLPFANKDCITLQCNVKDIMLEFCLYPASKSNPTSIKIRHTAKKEKKQVNMMGKVYFLTGSDCQQKCIEGSEFVKEDELHAIHNTISSQVSKASLASEELLHQNGDLLMGCMGQIYFNRSNSIRISQQEVKEAIENSILEMSDKEESFNFQLPRKIYQIKLANLNVIKLEESNSINKSGVFEYTFQIPDYRNAAGKKEHQSVEYPNYLSAHLKISGTPSATLWYRLFTCNVTQESNEEENVISKARTFKNEKIYRIMQFAEIKQFSCEQSKAIFCDIIQLDEANSTSTLTLQNYNLVLRQLMLSKDIKSIKELMKSIPIIDIESKPEFIEKENRPYKNFKRLRTNVHYKRKFNGSISGATGKIIELLELINSKVENCNFNINLQNLNNSIVNIGSTSSIGNVQMTSDIQKLKDDMSEKKIQQDLNSWRAAKEECDRKLRGETNPSSSLPKKYYEVKCTEVVKVDNQIKYNIEITEINTRRIVKLSIYLPMFGAINFEQPIITCGNSSTGQMIDLFGDMSVIEDRVLVNYAASIFAYNHNLADIVKDGKPSNLELMSQQFNGLKCKYVEMEEKLPNKKNMKIKKLTDLIDRQTQDIISLQRNAGHDLQVEKLIHPGDIMNLKFVREDERTPDVVEEVAQVAAPVVQVKQKQKTLMECGITVGR